MRLSWDAVLLIPLHYARNSEERPFLGLISLAWDQDLRVNFGVSNFPVIDHLCHAPLEVMFLVLILGFAGFVSGMIGFGFASMGVGVLWILPLCRNRSLAFWTGALHRYLLALSLGMDACVWLAHCRLGSVDLVSWN